MTNLNKAEMRQWAREEILECLDTGLVDFWGHRTNSSMELDMDDLIALREERNKIARRFRLPEKTITQLFPGEKV